jgi:hypothetical protein
MSIKQLPPEVVAQIKSSVAITSLNTVILGLVKNSLDARATELKLSLDYIKGSCSVTDNGIGISPAEFKEDGGLGKLHCGWTCDIEGQNEADESQTLPNIPLNLAAMEVTALF